MSSFANRPPKDLLARLRAGHVPEGAAASAPSILEDPTRFENLAPYRQIKIAAAAGRALDIASPFFRQAEAVEGTRVRIGGRWVTSFASYDYLSLNRSPQLAEAVAQAAVTWGGSATGSRMGGGECIYHQELETEIADFLQAPAALTFVSGHATNEAVLRTLTGDGDLILLDELCHNSIYEGARASGAAQVVFPHNDWEKLDLRLAELRHRYKRVLIVIEGLYSMDGDCPDLARFVEIKTRHQAWLMVDEAHSIGVVGQTGRGLCEAAAVARGSVDITMGTLSKALCSCGGFVAGSRPLIDVLKNAAPASVYSVAMAPTVVAAARAALAQLRDRPERVSRLAANGVHFRDSARAQGLDCGHNQGHAVAPVIVGDSLRAAWIAAELFKAGYAVTAVLAPAVPNRSARLRFFLNADHDEAAIDAVIGLTARLLEQSRSIG